MPTWDDLRREIDESLTNLGPAAIDILRRRRMERLAEYTGRPIIVYAVDFTNQSGKTQAAGREIQISLSDKEGVIEVTRDLPKGPVDLLVHSPGGDPLAAESIVELLRSKFDPVRVFIPNVAKSAATMLALSGDVLAIDERSELGPIDPQMVLSLDQRAVISPAQAILDQFERARAEIQKDPGALPGWLPILRQYGPSLLIESENAIALSKDLVKQWLVKYMYRNDQTAEEKARTVTSYFGDHNNFLSHGRMVGIEKIMELGIKVEDLREKADLRDRIWELYTMVSHTFDYTGAFKLIENNLGHAYIRIIQQVKLDGNSPRPASPSSPSKTPLPQSPPPNRAQRRQDKKGRK